MVAIALLVPWPGCSGRSRAPSSSPGPTAATSCRRVRATPAPRTSAGSSAGRPGRSSCSLDFAKGAIAAGVGLAIGGRAGRLRPRRRGGRRPHVPALPQGRQGRRGRGRRARRAVPADRRRPRRRLVPRGPGAAQGVARVAADHDSLPDRCFRSSVIDRWEVGVVAALAVLVVLRHSANIRRLLRR